MYTGPGGLIDITARKLAGIMEKDGFGSPLVVENKKGAGGILALSNVLRKPADGYTVFAFTNSVISKLVAAKQTTKLDQLHYLARVTTDYECLIARKDQLEALEQLKQQAQEKSGNQLWAGPAFGGTDNLFAMKSWDALGIKAKWIPYTSGGEAIASVLGRHADVYVGNPQDLAGRGDLHMLAVAAPERLERFPETPTFKELGYENLTGEMLWRGFAVRRGTPAAAVKHLQKSLEKATASEDWLQFVNNAAMIPSFDTDEAFAQLARTQIEEDKKWLLKR